MNARIKKLIFLTTSFIILVTGIYVFTTYAFVEIKNTSESAVIVTMNRPELADEDVSTFSLDANDSHRKLVKKGTYELIAWTEDASYYQNLSVKGLLQTVGAEITPQKEVKRTFVGDNPASCFDYLNDRLLSFPCGSSIEHTSIHLPATATSPTFIEKPFLTDFIMKGFAHFNDSTYAVVEAKVDAEGYFPGYSMYQVTSDNQLRNPVDIPEKNTDTEYEIVSANNKLYLLNAEGESLIYSSPSTPPERTTIFSSQSDELVALNSEASGGRFSLSYSDFNGVESVDLDNPAASENVISHITITDDSAEGKKYSVKGYYTQLGVCGDGFVCGVRAGSLEVFEIDAERLVKKWHVSGAEKYTSNGNNILIQTKEGMLRFDPGNGKGFYDIRFLGQTPCGTVDVNSGGYILCLISAQQKKSALLIEPNETVTVPIDKKAQSLHADSNVKDVSVYRNIIFISPDYGELQPQPGGGFGYAESTKTSVNSRIVETLKEQQIFDKGYKIKTTYGHTLN